MKRLVPVLVIAVIALTVLAACGSPAPEESPSGPAPMADGNYNVRIGFPSFTRDTTAPDGPDIWAVEKGFFEEEFARDGIKVEYKAFTGAAPAINEALAAGSLDMAWVADIGALIG